MSSKINNFFSYKVKRSFESFLRYLILLKKLYISSRKALITYLNRHKVYGCDDERVLIKFPIVSNMKSVLNNIISTAIYHGLDNIDTKKCFLHDETLNVDEISTSSIGDFVLQKLRKRKGWIKKRG